MEERKQRARDGIERERKWVRMIERENKIVGLREWMTDLRIASHDVFYHFLGARPAMACPQ